ncbi:DUF4224 domain-containing protein [Pectobacterium carotovorum]|uniref:DUF4224 domain-containing protein n=1 Tax=Pectobacterium carotovorum TaxID=554 RepID=UPI001F1E3236|nr:DUF4224 domain-containing protein [Pectobacterium carotovorum]
MEERDPSMTLITDEDMIEITGAHYPSVQCQILRENGIPFVRRRDGRPRTTWYNFNHPLSTRNKQPESEPDIEPNFSALDLPSPKRRKKLA